ncbi:Transcription repressor [Heracleum sosnowskyi]|uniref:Transcription repressor n=1 Tax=Heracleum sosnowskyi TaxID=360622 RepID=A0AAD8J3E9_9APIA|nr:Transcription repressor [Heracleum sosnowskyi]
MFPFTLKTYLQCLSNIKCLPVTTLPPETSPENKNQDHNHTTSTTLMKNFNPLCDPTSTSTSNLTCSADHDFFSNSSDISSDGDDSVPDFATVFASQRFFFSSPGRSNSIVESPNCPQDHNNNALVPDSVAIQTYSPDPLQDFRKSMQEMVEAHGIIDVKADWEFLHELLLCYLTLNPKQTHKYVIKAFSDLLVSLMSSESCRKIEDTSSPRLV